MAKRLVFRPVEASEIAVSDAHAMCVVVFTDAAGEQLELAVEAELGALMIQTLQLQFVAMQERKLKSAFPDRSPPASGGQLRWVGNIQADCPVLRARPSIRLAIEPGSRWEVTVGLEPDVADGLADQLRSAADQCRRLRAQQAEH